MKQGDIVVIGGSAASLTAAITARRHHPDRKVLIVRREKQVLIPCGIPYIFGTVGSPQKNLIGDAVLEKNGIELLLAEATDIDREQKVLHTTDGEVSYERFVLATGSRPVMLPIPGCDLKGVYSIVKDVEYLSELQQQVEAAKNVVVIGGGFIGIEFADEINKAGDKQVTVIEIAPHCLSLAYDAEFCVEMEKVVTSRGVHIRTSARVERIDGKEKVERVVLSDGTEVEADVVILDVILPTGYEGFETARAIREEHGLKELPIVMLTSLHDKRQVPYRFAPDETYLPVDVFLDKPIEPEALVDTINELLGERREEPKHPL